MFQWKTSKLRLNKRHQFVCGLNNLSFVTYHDMFAGEYQVGYGRFHGVEKLHSSSYVNGESQCLILIHNYTYNTHKYVVATKFTIYIYWDELSVKQFSFFRRLQFIVSHNHMISTLHYFLNDKKNMTHFTCFSM